MLSPLMAGRSSCAVNDLALSQQAHSVMRIEQGNDTPGPDVRHLPMLVSHGFQSDYERGFCNGLAAIGVAVRLISSDTTDYSGLNKLVRTVNLRGSQDRGRRWSAKAFNQARYHCKLLAFAASGPARLIHVFGLIEPTLLCGIVEGAWFRACAKRYVLTVHNLVPHDRHNAVQKVLSRLSFRLPHKLVVHTKRMRDELIRDYGIAPAKVIVMEHGLEPANIGDQAHRVVLADGVLRILFFGVIAQYKGVDLLLDSLEQFPGPFSLVIAGSCLNAALATNIEERIARHPARASISWRNGFVPEEDLPALFNQTDAVVLPYRHIDQSGVLFQAMRFGVPVVATTVGAFPDYLTSTLGELCSPDAGGIRAALIRLRSRLQEFSRAGIAEAGRRFEWSNTVRALVGIHLAG